MSKKLLVFGGTHEARQICAVLSRAGQPTEVCTATAYGAELVSGLPHITVRQGRLDALAMRELVSGGSYGAVIDATHPYAVEATANIRAACAGGRATYLRVVREPGLVEGNGDESPEKAGARLVRAPSVAEAVRLLSQRPGRILLTTGSRNLQEFCRVPGFAERIFVRVLPLPGILEQCLALGYGTGNIVAMRGPFSRELNAAMLKQLECSVLVTKDSGVAGGFAEKILGAADAGAEVVVIDRPEKEQGLTWQQVLEVPGVIGLPEESGGLCQTGE